MLVRLACLLLAFIAGAVIGQFTIDSDHCGIYPSVFAPDEDILYSVHARPNEFPWQVQIEDIFEFNVCSAVIIDDSWLLATASCVSQLPWRGIVPYAILERAYYNPVDSKPYRRTIMIQKIFKHPNYDAKTYTQDFALIKLAKPIPLADWSMQAVCLPDSDLHCDDYCQAGQTAFYVGWGRRTLTFQKAPVEIMDNDECDTSLVQLGDGNLVRSPTQICATACLDMCWFAAGSSLATYNNDTHQFTLCGIGSNLVNQELCTALEPFNENAPCVNVTRQPVAPRVLPGATGPIVGLGGSIFRPSDIDPALQAEEAPPGNGPLKKAAAGNQQRGRPVIQAAAPPTTQTPFMTDDDTTTDDSSFNSFNTTRTVNPTGPRGIFTYVCSAINWIITRNTLK